MAEYIDRNLIEWHGCDLEKNVKMQEIVNAALMQNAIIVK